MHATKHDTPLVSVVLPYRNAAPTLEAATASILNQTLHSIEILLIDDASGDDSPRIACQLSQQDQRVRLLTSPPPHGLVPSLNHGLREARAPFLARMDADDLSSPTRLEKQLLYMEQHPALAACGCGVHIIPDPTDPNHRVAGGFLRYQEWINSLTDPMDIRRERFIESPIAHPTAFFRADQLRNIGCYHDTTWPEDYDLWLRFLETGPVLGKVPETLLQWSDGATRLSRADPRYARPRFMAARAYYLTRLPDIEKQRIHICGAGPTGKLLARLLKGLGRTIHAFHDVHPRRVGATIQGIPVLPHDQFPPAGNTLLLAAVGQPQSRPLVRTLATEAGYTEGTDFYIVS